jgi:hypothetical protein
MKTSIVAEIQKTVKLYKGMSKNNPKEWGHRYLFVKVRKIAKFLEIFGNFGIFGRYQGVATPSLVGCTPFQKICESYLKNLGWNFCI